MEIVITYDISNNRHLEVKEQLQLKGFIEHWTHESTKYYLPNTTLWHKNLLTPDVAKRIFFEIIDQINQSEPITRKIDVERFMAFEITDNWSGIPGKPYTK